MYLLNFSIEPFIIFQVGVPTTVNKKKKEREYLQGKNKNKNDSKR